MTEREEALVLANKVLERPYADPDDDLAMLARQLVRSEERCAAIERGEPASGNQSLSIDELTARFYAVKGQRDQLLWRLSSVAEMLDDELRQFGPQARSNVPQAHADAVAALDEVREALATPPSDSVFADFARECFGNLFTRGKWASEVLPTTEIEASIACILGSKK